MNGVPSRGRTPLYEPCAVVVVRAPLLSVEEYLTLDAPPDGACGATTFPGDDADVRRALAVGSTTFLDAVTASSGRDGRPSKVDSTLLRYMIRMSTRPTPFGLFAGVGIGRWGEHTDLELSAGPRRQRTRPDMGWLMSLVMELESDPEVRRSLRFVANRAAFVRAGRVVLAERTSRGDVAVPLAVSLRATGVVRRALEAARDPVHAADLAAHLLATTPGATAEKVDTLLTELWENTLLLTDLRPPLTVDSPVEYVLDRLEDVPAAAEVRRRLRAMVDATTAWDGSPDRDVTRHRSLVADAATLAAVERTPFQIDAAVQLSGPVVSYRVGEEAARAVETLLRLSPLPSGPAHLAAYRRQFEQRYGAFREVPVLELLDPDVGLGPPLPYGRRSSADGGVPPAQSMRRNQILLDLAVTAARRRTRCVELDEALLERLATWDPATTEAPRSLDLYVAVAAASRDAVDAGEFHIVIGPNVGGMAAGRTLGRFTDMLPEAKAALQQIAATEEERDPERLWAELVYQPRLFRLGNVSTRTHLRAYEIPIGVTSGRDAAHTIPVDELVVGVRNDRFSLRWPRADREVVITAGHMLTHVRAPVLCRFLSEVGRDGCSQLAGFQWGAASTLPFLPRVQVGRAVLALAQWRVGAEALAATSRGGLDEFRVAVARWRDEWDVPRHVYLTEGDNRLLLDLTAERQLDELRRALSRRSPEPVVVTEVYPALDQSWVVDTRGRHYVTELVVPLVLRHDDADGSAARVVVAGADESRDVARPRRAADASPRVRLRPPGSDWVFAKLYSGHDGEDAVIAEDVRDLVERVGSTGAAGGWFFIRYNDPTRHLRIRFSGEPDALTAKVIPVVCAWADEMIGRGLSERFALDTYEREVERFGGDEGTAAAEVLFGADSAAVVELLRLLHGDEIGLPGFALAVLTVDALLDGLGLDVDARAQWSRRHVASRHDAGEEYRTWKGTLRPLLSDSTRVRGEPGGAPLHEILDGLRAAAAAYSRAVDDLAHRGVLTRSVADIHQSLVHLHLNRLLAADRATESRVLGLLWRVREGLRRSGPSAP